MYHPYTLPFPEKSTDPSETQKQPAREKKIHHVSGMISKKGTNMGALKTPVGKSYRSANEGERN
jgi:hypothetical protein